MTLGAYAESRSLKFERDGFIRISSDRPGVMLLSGNGRAIAACAGTSSEELTLFRYLEAGEYRILTRPFEGKAEMGTLGVASLQPLQVSSVTEDNPRFIAPGESDVFTFEVNAAVKVGVGIAQTEEVLSAELYDEAFTLLDTGPLVFRDLSPGNYFIIVRGKVKPMQYHPIVLGNRGSRREVPAELIENYRKRR